MLPPTDKPYFHQKVKALAGGTAGGSRGCQGAERSHYVAKARDHNGQKCDRATIEHIEGVATIWRAISKFIAVYDDVSPQMASWAKATGAELLAEKERAAKAGEITGVAEG